MYKEDIFPAICYDAERGKSILRKRLFSGNLQNISGLVAE